ncbi:MAG TPA: glycosyltransferase [Egibacteraceae bacterium]|nr:glycosyltransferase [Egibacteraceae bacterium]
MNFQSQLVSAVIPAYNAEQFVCSAVGSALDQTHANVEVIVVDDGSSDGTLAVLQEIADPRLRVIVQPNAGVSAARNRAIAESAGEYVAFLDADDVWDPTKLSRQLDVLEEHPEWTGVGALMHHVGAEGRVLGVAGHRVGPAEQRAIREARLNPFPISSLLVRRAVIDRVGLFDEDLHRHAPGGVEDLDFVSRIAAAGFLGCVEEVLGGYRMHGGSSSARYFRSQRQGARYLVARTAARAAGDTLTFADFERGRGQAVRHWWIDTAAYCYRAAGVALAEGQPLHAVWWAAPALIMDPARTLRRLALQRGRLRSYPSSGPYGGESGRTRG